MARTRSKATARKKKKAASVRAKTPAPPAAPVVRLYTPERAHVMGRLAEKLWGEMRDWLGALETELVWLGGGGEAAVLACRGRVRMMRGAMQGLAADHRELCAKPGDYLEAWRWLDEFRQAAERWLNAFQADLEEVGTTPENAEIPRDDTRFTPDYGRGLQCLREAYGDWWFVAWNLGSIEASDVSEEEVRKIDAECERIALRARERRPVLKAMPKRDLRWGWVEARRVKFVL
jgi:hypothetical protein